MVHKPTITDERRLRIILLEDDPALAGLFVELIGDWHPNVDLMAVQNGDQAWRELLGRQVDLFITDCIHPGLSGFEILLGLADQGAEFPILWTSSISSDERAYCREVLEGSRLHVTRLPKPFSLREFQAAVSRLLRPHCGMVVLKRHATAREVGKSGQRNQPVGRH